MEPRSIDEAALEKLRHQFDNAPYPRIPLDQSPQNDYESLYIHSLVTAYYLRYRKVINPKGKLILDAGCGTGYKSFMLAAANPGARIIGIDLSEASIRLAQERLKYHGFDNVEFYALRIEELSSLNLTFDYINCDEVLYLMPDPIAGLQAMQAVLKPEGLIRANLHNSYQRAPFYRSQQLFKFMGLMGEETPEFEEEVVTETMNALRDQTRLKDEAWNHQFKAANSPERLKELLHANFLLWGDKGYTIPDLFDMLEQANLEFVSMVAWQQWDIMHLFKDPDNLPLFWSIGLAEASIAEKLHLYELLNPTNRLMDFWCSHPTNATRASIEDWEESDWRSAIVHLHPQLRNDQLKQDLLQCIQTAQPFEISSVVKTPAFLPVLLNPMVAACLLPLWDSAQPIQVLIDRYLKTHPIDPITLEPNSEPIALQQVKDLLSHLDSFLYILLDRA